MTPNTAETIQATMFVTVAAIMYGMLVYVAYALSAIAHHVWF